MFQASIDTRHFSFEAYGETEAEALAALLAGLDRHAVQYRIEPGFVSIDHATIRQIAMGVCYRDRAPIGFVARMDFKETCDHRDTGRGVCAHCGKALI